MNLRPLVIDANSRAAIKKVVEFAEANRQPMQTLMENMAGRVPPIGRNPGHRCVVPVGYSCVFSIEEQPSPLNWCRHLSVAVLGDGDAPNEHAVLALAEEFGMKPPFDFTYFEHHEPTKPNKVAVSIGKALEPVTGNPSVFLDYTAIPAKGPREADMTISGVPLTPAQSMTVRVALQMYGMELQKDGLGPDKTGKGITAGYLARIHELNELIGRTAR